MNLLSLAVLTATVSVVPGNPTVVLAEADSSLLTIERNIVEHTNVQRVRHGLRPLQIDLRLVQGARQQATWMARNRIMRHGNAPVAENIAAGQSTSREVLQDWMNSSGHRANILSSSYRRIGAAAYRGRDGQVYWCQQFLQ